MKVDRRALYGALQELVRVTVPKASLPALSHVLLQAIAGVLTLRTTDLRQILTCQLAAEGDIETCLSAKLLATLIKPEGRGDAGDVVIEQIDTVSCAVTLDGLTSKIIAMDPDEFPSGPADGEWSLLAMWPSAQIIEALSYVLPAASKDDGRPHLNAVRFDNEKIVTTDGHRLHLAPLPSKLLEPLTIPLDSAKTLSRILKLGGQVILAGCEGRLRARVGSWQLDTKLIEERFPPYEKVIPNEQPTVMSVDHTLLSKALTRVSRLGKSNLVKLTINGAMTLATSNPDLGEAEVAVPLIETNHNGADIIMGLNPTYLRDAVGTQTDTIQFGMSGTTDAVTLDMGGPFAVIMPTRL